MLIATFETMKKLPNKKHKFLLRKRNKTRKNKLRRNKMANQ